MCPAHIITLYPAPNNATLVLNEEKWIKLFAQNHYSPLNNRYMFGLLCALLSSVCKLFETRLLCAKYFLWFTFAVVEFVKASSLTSLRVCMSLSLVWACAACSSLSVYFVQCIMSRRPTIVSELAYFTVLCACVCVCVHMGARAHPHAYIYTSCISPLTE